MRNWPFALSFFLFACVTPHRDPVTVAQYTFDVQLDEELTEPAPKDRPQAIVRRTLEKNLGRMQADYPAAFAREMPRLQRVEVRQLAGEDIEVVAILRDPRAELKGGDVARALEMDFVRTLDASFAARPPDQVSAAEAAEWFDWERLRDANSERVTSDVLRFAGAVPNVERRVHRWLAERADRPDVFAFITASLDRWIAAGEMDVLRAFAMSADKKRLADFLSTRGDRESLQRALGVE